LLQGRTAFESLAFFASEPATLSHNGFGEPVESAAVSGSFFATAGGRLQSGRGLIGSDAGKPVMVASDRLARRLFGGEDPLGRSVRIGDRSYEIVGVAHPSFQLPGRSIDVWLPAAGSRCCPFAALARLKPGLTAARALDDVNGALSILGSQSPRVYAGARAVVVSLREQIVGDARMALWVLLASSGLLLLTACANAANLLFSLGSARAREIAIRVAIGASRRDLLRQALTESALAVAVAAGLALLAASAVLDVLLSAVPAGVSGIDPGTVRIDAAAFSFALAIAGLAAAIVAALPALARQDLAGPIQSSGATGGRRRRLLQDALVVSQLAISVALLVGAALAGRSLAKLMTTDMGIRPEGVAAAAINLSYERRLTDAQQRVLLDGVVDRIRALPGVRSVGAGAALPPTASTIQLTLKRSGDAVDYRAVAVPATTGYFSALGVQLLRGRLFSDADGESQPQVMVMTEATARRFFGDGDPIGRSMTLPVLRNGAAGSADVTLVGVIANVKHSGLEAAADDAVYRPLQQQAWPLLFLVARTTGDANVLAAALRREIAAVDPVIAVSAVDTLDDIVLREASQPRFRARVIAALAGFTLVIASAGLYAVVAHTVSQRTKEIGIRIALGARRPDVLRLVFTKGAALAGCGIALGAAGALAAARIAAGLLYGIGPADPVSFAAASGLMLLVGAAATYVPAHRASRLDPTAALRRE
jgi:putative ABC transport system permease protein